MDHLMASIVFDLWREQPVRKRGLVEHTRDFSINGLFRYKEQDYAVTSRTALLP